MTVALLGLSLQARLNRLDGMARYGWDLLIQAASIRKLAGLNFLWILPGHGRRWRFADDEERVEEIVRHQVQAHTLPSPTGLPTGLSTLAHLLSALPHALWTPCCQPNCSPLVYP